MQDVRVLMLQASMYRMQSIAVDDEAAKTVMMQNQVREACFPA
jgi:hypothetical protein